MNIETERLELVAATLEMVLAGIRDRKKLGSLLSAEVPENWPPPLVDEPSMPFAERALSEHPDARGWSVWYSILREGQARVIERSSNGRVHK